MLIIQHYLLVVKDFFTHIVMIVVFRSGTFKPCGYVVSAIEFTCTKQEASCHKNCTIKQMNRHSKKNGDLL